MNAEHLARLYGFTYFTLQRNTEGVTHEESLRSPSPGGSSLNWVLGHILASRMTVHRLAGVEPLWTESDAAPYARGTAPPADPALARPLGSLVADLGRSQERLLPALGALSAAQLAEPAGGEDPSPRAWQLLFFHFHESYHAGQAGLLRRLAGHAGAIR